MAVVVGAGSSGPGWGNGKAAATLFAREGACIFAVDIDSNAARETCSLIREEGGTAELYEADVTDGAAVEELVASCLRAYGRIDVLHNNVGVVALGGPVELSESEWDRVHAVNLKSFFLTAKYVLPQMEHQGAGAIVNVSSVASIRWTGISYLAYASSKAAVNQLTQAIAIEYAPKGIRCNAVLPGLMNTPMVQRELADVYPEQAEQTRAARDARCPTGKMGDAWDVAYASLFLASDESRYITGHCLVVDGGLTCISA